MPEGKRYYWLKLKEDFFKSKRIKKLRNMAGGDTYTIIYLKMQLLSLRTDGVLQWTGLEDNFADELALDLDEKPEDVEVTLMYLLKTGLAETIDNVSFVLPWVLENTGSEGASAQRWRDWKERKALESNTHALDSNTILTDCKQITNGEKEIDKDIEIELEKRGKKQSKKFVPPTLEEVKAYIQENGYSVDADKFWNYYNAGHWKRSDGKPVLNWKQTIITWANKESTTVSTRTQTQKKYTTNAEYVPPKPKSMDDLRRMIDMI